MDLIKSLLNKDDQIFVIAEMSGNHNQTLDRALAIVDAAADAGAHAIKLQTYTAETMTLDLHTDEFFISDSKSLWYGQNMFSLFQKSPYSMGMACPNI